MKCIEDFLWSRETGEGWLRETGEGWSRETGEEWSRETGEGPGITQTAIVANAWL